MQVRSATRAAIAAALLLGVSGCSLVAAGPGERVSRELDIAATTSVILATPGDLVVSVGDTPSLTVTAGETVIDRFTARMVDGALRLEGSSDGPLAGAVRYELTLPVLDTITIEGSGSVRADFAGSATAAVTIRGSGDVSGENLAATTVATLVEGSGTVHLAGTTTEQTLTIRGSGGFEGRDLSSERATVDIEGSGDAELTVTERLTASIAGSGDIRHAGGAVVDGSIAGSGDISAL
jgi:hypothetical protein